MAQLKPGYDAVECAEVLSVSALTGRPAYQVTDSLYIQPPRRFSLLYRSKELGLKNMWELWASPEKQIMVSIRGTAPHMDSWLENFYAAMVPAKGYMNLSDADTFHYIVSHDDRAAVHAGWLLGTAFIAREVIPAMDSCYRSGIRDLIITGHSQGGGISYLLTAYLKQMQLSGKLPADWRIKTYSTAPPKPGNLYFAYDYEAMMGEGWGLSIINSDDWVPELPFSIQTTDDFNRLNPIPFAKDMIRKQKFPRDLAYRHVYNRLDKPLKKARKRFQKYMGTMMSHQVDSKLDGAHYPGYFKSNHYVRTGTAIVYKPDAAYYELFPQMDKNFFMHHSHRSYLFLINPLLIKKP